jgi:hypothetical protein
MLDPRVDPSTREMAAWWLRRRPFGFDAVMRETRTVLAGDADPARRAAAAAAIGEFMDWHGVQHLATALTTDTDARVRTAAVIGLARINSPRGLPLIAAALQDSDRDVVEAALRSVLRAENAHFTLLWVKISRAQRLVLQALASEPGRVQSSQYRIKFGLPAASSVQRAIEALTADELVAKRSDGAYQIVEPFLKEWVLGFAS